MAIPLRCELDHEVNINQTIFNATECGRAQSNKHAAARGCNDVVHSICYEIQSFQRDYHRIPIDNVHKKNYSSTYRADKTTPAQIRKYWEMRSRCQVHIYGAILRPFEDRQYGIWMCVTNGLQRNR